MIHPHPQHELAAMPIQDLQEHLQEVCFEKKELAETVKFFDSPLGQHAIGEWRKRLDEALLRYGKIRVTGVQDRDIVMAFVENRCAELFLRDEIERMEGVKKRYDGLDKYQALCESVIKSKEKSARTAR